MKVVRLLAVVAGALLLVVGLFSYLVLPGLIESRLATNLQAEYGLEEKPSVAVSSNFPPELLLGRMDRIEIQIDSFMQEGIRLRDLLIDLRDVDVSVPSLFRGNLEREVRAASLVAEAPEESINEYLRENDLGLAGGEIDVRLDQAVYRSKDVFFGFPASVGLNLQVAGPHIIEVVPQEVTLAGLSLPPFLTESLASGGRTLTVSDLPFEAGLVSVEPQNDALVIRAER